MARKQGSHGDITGPRVREAALRLIARHGFAAVSMRMIAAEVGVQAGALYNYTPDKQSLLFDLMQQHMQDLMDALNSREDVGGTPLDQLDAFTRFHIRWHLNRQDGVFVSYMELRNLTPENFEQIEDLRNQYEQVLQDIVSRGAEQGIFQVVDARLTTMALIALLTGVTNWYKNGGRLSVDEIEEVYVDLMRKSLGVMPHTQLAAQ